jgi:hypothetical protein
MAWLPIGCLRCRCNAPPCGVLQAATSASRASRSTDACPKMWACRQISTSAESSRRSKVGGTLRGCGAIEISTLEPRPCSRWRNRGVASNSRVFPELLRSDFANGTAGKQPNGDLTDSFVPATEAPYLHQSSRSSDRSTLGKVVQDAAQAQPAARELMRGRHLPRLCRSCHSPMARQEDTCWNCGAAWEPADPASTEPTSADPTATVGAAVSSDPGHEPSQAEHEPAVLAG